VLRRGAQPTVLDDFDFAFAENGLTAFKHGQPLPGQSFIQFVGEERYKKLVNFILHYIADLDIPIKRCASLLLWSTWV
jgi:phosphomannomutase